MAVERFATGVRIVETTAGVRRWYARCDVHPDWHPSSGYDRGKAVGDADFHSRDVHDGIDYSRMPQPLVEALHEVRDVEIRRRLARAARQWATPPPVKLLPQPPEPIYYQCRDCTYGTYGVEDFKRHADEEGHVLELAGEG